MCIYTTFSSINGNLGYLHALVIVSNVAINMGLQIFEFLFLFPSNKYFEVELLDHTVVLSFNFDKSPYCFP